MERRLKERLIGASVLVMLAVILIPMILDDTTTTDTQITQSNIPQRPVEGFTSEIVPLPEPAARPVPPEAVPERPQPAVGQPAVDAPPAPATAVPAEASPELPAARAETPASPAPAHEKPAPQPDRVGVAAWVVQLGSFASEENANALGQRLRQAGYAAFVEPIGEGSERAYRVRIGPELLKSDAQSLADRLKSNMKLEGIVLAYP